MRRRALAAAVALAMNATASQPQPLQGGIAFQGADVQAQQRDEFGNPGLLWVTRGEWIWGANRGAAGIACASCHGKPDAMKGVAARHPRYDPVLGKVVNLEQRINACVTRHQRDAALEWESQALLGLTTLLAYHSRGMPIAVDVEGPAHATFERGRTLHRERQGQLHLACTHCHDANWGRRLLGETLSQGHPADWPAYRLEWQSIGSLQRRLRACYFGVRAEVPDFGASDLVALELYLAHRARGLPTSAPGVRR